MTMHNTITVSYIKDLYKVIAAINLKGIEVIEEIKTSKEANEIALNLLKKYESQGIEVETFDLW